MPAEPDLLADLAERGLIADHTDLDELRRRMAEGPITLYCGFDPTADSLHFGNLVPLLVLRRFQEAGHRPIAVAGGATGLIGDPSGRSEERPLLDPGTLARNLEAITAQISRLLDPDRSLVLDNRSWTEPVGVLEFLRDVGKHITVGSMLAKESVRRRLEGPDGLSFTEFSYMLLQAHDYLWLHTHHDCVLQVGGSDQWGNITCGIELIRKRTGAAVSGLTVPILTDASGQKVGKSTGGDRIWLSAERTSPYRFYQHWMNTDDRDVERFLCQLTLLDVDECRAIAEAHRQAPERREGQRRLAWEVTALVHGPAAADAAERASAVLFGGDPTGAAPEVLEMVAGEVGSTAVEVTDGEGIDPVDALCRTGLAASRSDARRAIAEGSLYVMGRRWGPDPIPGDMAVGDRWILLRRGKRRYHLLELRRAGPGG